ncbi:MAG TPA: hypothetical protein VE733_23745 [Streptosporangiaceae bacterium]|nr:hypothetical protein [Streptosporangiaceae bacterium]
MDFAGVGDDDAGLVGEAEAEGDVDGDAELEPDAEGDGLPAACAAPGTATMTARPAATPRASSLLMIPSFPS